MTRPCTAHRGCRYALLVVFSIRTAVELHRAWHMTLLTTALLNQIKDKFSLRMTWDLGVTKLKFRIEVRRQLLKIAPLVPAFPKWGFGCCQPME